MSQKHTPGPYKVNGPFLNSKTIGISGPPKDNGWATCLAEISITNVGEGTAIANANLFAAAPEMKRLLESAVTYMNIGELNQEDLIAEIKHILAKIEGRV